MATIIGRQMAKQTPYDNNASGLAAKNVQQALDEIATGGGAGTAENITYDNDDSGLTADDVQAAIDELAEADTLADSTTVVRNTGTPGQVSLDAQVAAILQQAKALVADSSVTTKQNDYSPTGLSTAHIISWRGAGSTGFTGLAGGAAGREITIVNDTTDYLLWLEHENTSSSAANRFSFPSGFPQWLMPGDTVTLQYSDFRSRWGLKCRGGGGLPMGLTEFSDFLAGPSGPFTITVSGTGATGSANSNGADATEKAKGNVALEMGTTTTGRSSIGSSTAGVPPTIGTMLAVGRVLFNNAVSGTETFRCLIGFTDAANGTLTDGMAWDYHWNGSAAEWQTVVAAATVETASNTSAPAAGTTFTWLVVFVNANGTRADFISSGDSMAFVKAQSVTVGLPAVTNLVSAGICAIKSAGTTNRQAVVDLFGYRVDGARG